MRVSHIDSRFVQLLATIISTRNFVATLYKDRKRIVKHPLSLDTPHLKPFRDPNLPNSRVNFNSLKETIDKDTDFAVTSKKDGKTRLRTKSKSSSPI